MSGRSHDIKSHDIVMVFLIQYSMVVRCWILLLVLHALGSPLMKLTALFTRWV